MPPTGCGKTYTMLGTDREPGIYIRTLNDLFKAIEETSDDMEYEVIMSYLEVNVMERLTKTEGKHDARATKYLGVFLNVCMIGS